MRGSWLSQLSLLAYNSSDSRGIKSPAALRHSALTTHKHSIFLDHDRQSFGDQKTKPPHSWSLIALSAAFELRESPLLQTRRSFKSSAISVLRCPSSSIQTHTRQWPDVGLAGSAGSALAVH